MSYTGGWGFIGLMQELEAFKCCDKVQEMKMNINGYELVETCWACPEQYDVFKDGKMVAYFRLRHGEFRVDVPDCGGETIFESEDSVGDGRFEENEQMEFLTQAVNAVHEHYMKLDKL